MCLVQVSGKHSCLVSRSRHCVGGRRRRGVKEERGKLPPTLHHQREHREKQRQKERVKGRGKVRGLFLILLLISHIQEFQSPGLPLARCSPSQKFWCIPTLTIIPYVHMCMCACVQVCRCARVHVCMCACVHVCRCARVHVCMCECMSTLCVHVCV